MLKNRTAARTAAEEGADGVHDYPHSTNYRQDLARMLLDGGPFVPVNSRTDGFHVFGQNDFEGWPGTATPLNMIPVECTHNKHQLRLFVTPSGRQPVVLGSFLHPIA